MEYTCPHARRLADLGDGALFEYRLTNLRLALCAGCASALEHSRTRIPARPGAPVPAEFPGTTPQPPPIGATRLEPVVFSLDPAGAVWLRGVVAGGSPGSATRYVVRRLTEPLAGVAAPVREGGD